MSSVRVLTGWHDFERITFSGACNAPMPGSWQDACRRHAGHGGAHHGWRPVNGTAVRVPGPGPDGQGRVRPRVIAFDDRMTWEAAALSESAYASPRTTDRVIAAIRYHHGLHGTTATPAHERTGPR